MQSKLISLLCALLLPLPSLTNAAPWKIYLLFGQSNMSGGATPGPDDVFNNPRVKVLAYNNCSGRAYNEWYMATGSLHCANGFGIGDWFGKIMADTLRQDTIALIPCAIPGVDIDLFRKGVASTRRSEFFIPPDNHWDGAYPWMVERLEKALEKGELSGILLHQGESDWTDAAQNAWPGKVAGIISDLKNDLNFGDVPVMLGELRADSQACCGGNNAYVAQAANDITNAHVVSSAGLTVINDVYHFDAAGLREFGKRYAAEYLQAWKATPLTASPGIKPAPIHAHWRIRVSSSARSLEFDQDQHRILIRDARGRRLAEGAGRSLNLPANGKNGLLFFEASSGSSKSSGALFALP